MKLFYAPNACSLGIHVLLEEVGQPYELVRVDLAGQEHHRAEYKAINPKSKVPALMLDDGTVITEFPAIAFYLGRSFPEAKLWPADPLAETKVFEAMEYLIATVHMRGFTRIFRPTTFTPTPEDVETVKQTGREMVAEGLDIVAQALGDKPYVTGEISVADAALFYVEHWAATRINLALPPAIEGHLQRMRARPAVQRALAAEGLA